MKTKGLRERRGRLALIVISVLSALFIWQATSGYSGVFSLLGKKGTQAITNAATPEGSLSVTAYGAKGNGKSDALPAFKKTIAIAKKQAKSVYVPPGNYLLSGRLTVDGVKVAGAGAGVSILTSTDPTSGSIDLRGTDVSLQDVSHVYRSTAARDGADAKNSVTVLGASNFSIRNVSIVGASTAGILVRDGSANGVIADNIIKNTKADGIHITDGSKQITIENNTIKQTGDDTIAVVSYKKDPAITSSVVIRGNSVGYASGARGISVVGGSGVTIEKNKISNTEMAGIYIAVESGWETRNVSNVSVSGNTIRGAGTRLTDDHPNVLVFADEGSIDEVRFVRNVISDSVNAGIGVWGDGQIGNIYFTSNQVKNSGQAAATFKKGQIHTDGNSGF